MWIDRETHGPQVVADEGEGLCQKFAVGPGIVSDIDPCDELAVGRVRGASVGRPVGIVKDRPHHDGCSAIEDGIEDEAASTARPLLLGGGFGSENADGDDEAVGDRANLLAGLFTPVARHIRTVHEPFTGVVRESDGIVVLG